MNDGIDMLVGANLHDNSMEFIVAVVGYRRRSSIAQKFMVWVNGAVKVAPK
jgi:hypothetical protein